MYNNKHHRHRMLHRNLSHENMFLFLLFPFKWHKRAALALTKLSLSIYRRAGETLIRHCGSRTKPSSDEINLRIAYKSLFRHFAPRQKLKSKILLWTYRDDDINIRRTLLFLSFESKLVIRLGSRPTRTQKNQFHSFVNKQGS